MLVVTVVLLASQMTQAIAQEQDQSVNVLFILADQLRYDAIGYVQSRLPEYEGKLRVRTPNLDRLASMGITFGTAYCQYASCSQARATLKTGCTVGRHGVTHNYLANKEIYERMSIFKERIERLQSFEQILGQYKNYTVETYGKWHVPLVWYGRNGTVRSTYYSYADNAFRFALDMLFTSRYRESLRYFNASVRASLQNTNEPGNPMLRNRYSTFPYTPIQLDYRRMIREGANSHHRWLGGDSEDRSFSGSIESTNHHYYFSKKDMALRPMDDTEVDSDSPTNPTSPALTRGRDSLAANYTSTAIEGDMALRALNRLLKEETMNPFFLSVHFNSPVRLRKNLNLSLALAVQRSRESIRRLNYFVPSFSLICPASAHGSNLSVCKCPNRLRTSDSRKASGASLSGSLTPVSYARQRFSCVHFCPEAGLLLESA
jgi:hypothetical protein